MNYKDNNPKSLVGATKVPMHLIPPSAMHYLALALEDGARKYGPFNWRVHPISASTYRGARLRHDDAYWDGEDVATDSKIHHLAHLMACCAIEIDALELGMLVDDRPPPGSSSRLQAAYLAKSTQSYEKRLVDQCELMIDDFTKSDQSTGV